MVKRSWYNICDDELGGAKKFLDFPTILFLDPTILQHGHIETSRPSFLVPAHIFHTLGEMDEIRASVTKFFKNIHVWMPFISKKRFWELHLRSSFQSQPDTVLLLLAIKLITTAPLSSQHNARSSLYQDTKHFYQEIERSNSLSFLTLQAGVLIALYELGHAIYPAAFLSIGACARYAYALGINSTQVPGIRKVLTLIEIEERRRIWWAIIILDRSDSPHSLTILPD